MKQSWIKRSLPRGLYGRAALILIVPILTLQIVVSIVFIQRHFDGVTVQMTRGLERELTYLLHQVARAPDPNSATQNVAELARDLQFEIALPANETFSDARLFFDLSGRALIRQLHLTLPEVIAVDVARNPRVVHILLETAHGNMVLDVSRRQLSASNPHQLLVLMLFTGLLMTLIAFLFLRNQLRPIQRLSRASEAFGKGRAVTYKPSGAIEVRQAGQSFLDMRARIERQIEQRTLMLSGVSHDLRTPLTRMKLALSLQDETPETDDMQRDIADMERMLDAFLDFARSEALDDINTRDPAAFLHDVIGRFDRSVELGPVATGIEAPIRPLAVQRALENLLNNALNYGGNARVSLEETATTLRFVVEDDGPGIPPDQRDAALQAFTRLDSARNQNRGPGVGLGLAIASDIARQHGGILRLTESPDMGGLRAELVLAR